MRTLNAVATDDNPKILILPWLTLAEPAEYDGVEILPRRDAIERGRSFGGFDLSLHVERATSYFGSGSRYPRSLGLPLDSLREDDVAPELVQPSVIFLDDTTTVERVDDLLATLNFACMAASTADRYTNAVVFERYVQTLVQNPEYIVPMSRQMFGVKTTGTRAINLLVTRAHRCGEFQTPDRLHWEAISKALHDRKGMRVMRAVRALMLATQDIETLPEDVERSMFAIVLERLVALSRAERRQLGVEIVAERIGRGVEEQEARKISAFDLQLLRSQKLLRPLLGPQVQTIKFGYDIMRAWHAIRRERNGVWHSELRTDTKYNFEKQSAVRLNLIWFRVAQALIIAELVEAGFADVNGNLALAVPAIEAWLGAIAEEDSREAQKASATNAWWSTAMVCATSILARRETGDWRAYFSDHGDFVIPARRAIPA